MIKNVFFLLVLNFVFYSFTANSQVTVTFKPDSTVGKDVIIMMHDNDCIANGYTETPSEVNYETEQVIMMKDWTWNAIGCSGGTVRGLLCFTQLDSIPSNAVILSATLRLYGTDIDVNTSYPGAPSGYYSNDVIVQEITSPWDESTVTWNTQPSTTTTNQFNIPPSTSKYFWNYTNNSTNLVNMVQNMVSGNNYGFMLRLQTEQHYRNMVFASSDHPDSTLWPELEVTYRVCNPHFSFCVANTGEDTLQYSFTALNQAGSHLWTLGGDTISTNPSFTQLIPQGVYNGLCHTIMTQTDTCSYCMKLCYSFSKSLMEQDVMTDDVIKDSNFFVKKAKLSFGDIVEELVNSEEVRAVPNPSNGKLKLYFNSIAEDLAFVGVYDAEGYMVFSEERKVKKGENVLEIDCERCKSGTHVILVKGKNLNVNQTITVIKN